MTDHTPTPWEIDDDGPTVYLYAKIDKDNWKRGYVAYTTDFSSNAPHLANAQFIAKAVNNHDALVKALQALVDNINDYERVNNLAPNPGRTECWDTVAHAKVVLGAVGGPAS